MKDGEVTYDLIVGIETMAHWNAVLDFGKQEMTIDEQTISMGTPRTRLDDHDGRTAR